MELNFKEFMRVDELFNNLSNTEEVPITWEPSLTAGANKEHYRAHFTIDDDPYVVGFSRVETMGVRDFYVTWDLNRGRVSWWTVIKSIFTGSGVPYSRTGYGTKKGMSYTLRVLKGVLLAIKTFIETAKPTILTYYEHDSRLKEFYDHIVRKFALHVGYRPYRNHSGILVRSDKLKDPSVAKSVAQYLKHAS